jgi:hypothetical protein
MKKVLIGYQGWVSEIREPGEEYEIYEGEGATMAWVDAPDDITLDWTLEYSPSQNRMVWVERDAPYTDNAVARKVAYGKIEEQLDIIYHDIAENGALNADGAWFQHVAAVKSMIAKPATLALPIEMTGEASLRAAATTDPDPEKPNRPSTQEMPAWKRFPGWKGFSS